MIKQFIAILFHKKALKISWLIRVQKIRPKFFVLEKTLKHYSIILQKKKFMINNFLFELKKYIINKKKTQK